MLISQNELKKSNINLSVEELQAYLIQLGHEVEEVTALSNDKVVVGKVVSIQKHPDADKLNVCQVDVGNEVLQIVCGAPNVYVEQYVLVALEKAILPGNFKIKKSKIRGVESRGMICSLAELGIDSAYLRDEDVDGIYNFSQAQELGSNGLACIGLDDNILDLGLTANRGDCQSYRGVVRDLRALLNQKETMTEIDLVSDYEADFEVANLDEATSFLSAQKILNIDVVDSDEQTRLFLAKHNIKPQNNIVDFANMTMLKTGIPMHTYDLDKLSGSIKAEVLQKETKFVAIDEKEYDLPVGTLVITDDEKIVAIASVIGSLETRVTNDTKNILVEIGSFDPVKVRVSAQAIGKKTDASQRGEKNIDSVATIVAYQMYNESIKTTIAQAQISDVVFSNDLMISSNLIKLNHNSIKRVLGIEIERAQVQTILDNLHFELIESDGDVDTYLVPTWRFDVANDHDLIEEVIRVYSMDSIEDSEVLSSFNLKHNIITEAKIAIERDLENLVLNLGLNQVITYSLVGEDYLTSFGGKVDNAIKLMSPMSSKREYYRQSLVPSLLETTQYNIDRQNGSVNIFEIGNIYAQDGNQVVESFKLAGLMSGKKANSYIDGDESYDFYDLKGVLNGVAKHYDLDLEVVKTDKYEELNPYAQADIIINGHTVGFIGLKHLNYFNKIKQDVYVFEIDLGKIDAHLVRSINYRRLSTNPSVYRDLTFTCPRETTYTDVVEVFAKIAHLKKYKLIDVYTGDKIDATKSAITLNLEFASDEVTLTGEVVDASIEKIVKKAVAKGFEFNNG